MLSSSTSFHAGWDNRVHITWRVLLTSYPGRKH
jgi:hypothetical protein